MRLYFASLNSGSNGNCYYVGNERDAVLVDAGISCRETERRMARLGLDMGLVRAIFISHEHSDHIKGLQVLSKKHRLPVYISESTHRQCSIPLQAELLNRFSDQAQLSIGSLQIKAFSKPHDAADPYSFTISCGERTIGVFTDIGAPCAQLEQHFNQCHAAFLEANYDEHLLLSGRYPWPLKNRIRSGQGHLSNAQALALFLAQRPPFMTHLLLSHLSRDNNHPDIVSALFAPHAGNICIAVASRDQESRLYCLEGVAAPTSWPDPTPGGSQSAVSFQGATQMLLPV